ncbi:MAG: site-2 protease family protein [Acidimicrobiales bacterium]
MRASMRLGNIAGVSVGIHWSVALIAVLLTISLAGTILPASAPGLASAAYLVAALATAGLFLSSIVAHELGHSIVARRNGIGVRDITLFALGGVAALETEPRTPGAAARIALAGPAVSVAVGAGSLVAALAAGGAGFSTLTVAALTWLGVINLALAVFNMIPALPLDGGRVLQAALWKRGGDRHRATISAATVGRYAGWLVVGVGVFQFIQGGGGGLWTAFIGFFIVTSARAEEFRARFDRRREEWARTTSPPFGPQEWPGWGQGPPPPQPPRGWPGQGHGPTRPHPGFRPGPRPDTDVIDVDVIDVRVADAPPPPDPAHRVGR